MKKAITFLSILFALTVSAQEKKPSIKISNEVSKSVAYMKGTSDTLELTDAVKFIKIGNRVFPTDALNKSLIIMDAPTIESLLNDIAEYPAKFANPFSQQFLKKFGISINPPKQ